MIKFLELFSGNCNMSNAFKKYGWETYTVDWDSDLNPDLCADISKLTSKDIIELCNGKPDVIWGSPDCITYSISAISKHRVKNLCTGYLEPKTDYALFCDKCNIHVKQLIDELQPKYWFIENPRGGFRKMRFYPDKYRYTVTYCQYGDNRQKPTDIYTNHPNPDFKPMCSRGSPCHISAPRGSKTGTQGLKNYNERSNIPKELCEHIVKICMG